jgi:hypothetical protein
MKETTTEVPPSAALRLRALAHPMRWKVIDLLESEGSATATRCAEGLAESVASCSYHLGILAKYGYVELVPGTTGREKPWRLTDQQDLSAQRPDTEEVLAAQAAGEAFLDHELARMKSRIHDIRLEPPEWRAASGAAGTTVYATAAELGEIKDVMTAALSRYEVRRTDAALRPANARRSRVFFSTSVDPS